MASTRVRQNLQSAPNSNPTRGILCPVIQEYSGLESLGWPLRTGMVKTL